jgi:hypothetical protein
LRLRDFVSDPADGGRLRWWLEPIVPEHVHGRGGRSVIFVVQPAMRSVKTAPFFGGKLIPRFFDVDQQAVLHECSFRRVRPVSTRVPLSMSAASRMTDVGRRCPARSTRSRPGRLRGGVASARPRRLRGRRERRLRGPQGGRLDRGSRRELRLRALRRSRRLLSAVGRCPKQAEAGQARGRSGGGRVHTTSRRRVASQPAAEDRAA